MQSEIIHYYKIDAVPNKQRIADIKNCQKKKYINAHLFKYHKQI